MQNTWTGDARLDIFRRGASLAVHLELYRKPSPPGRTPGWGGSFRAPPFSLPATGRAEILFDDGTAADVMVESFDALTGTGTFFGLGAPPPAL
jgi:hypothetical protein